VLRELEAERHTLLLNIEQRYHDFSDLDERFHRLTNDASQTASLAAFATLSH
jgi:DNA-binding GntR family transcriptional regulator